MSVVFTHEVYNTSTNEAVSHHTSSTNATNEAAHLNAFHNSSIFTVRTLAQGQSVADPKAELAYGDGALEEFQPIV